LPILTGRPSPWTLGGLTFDERTDEDSQGVTHGPRR
jgi:hypothetical protein